MKGYIIKYGFVVLSFFLLVIFPTVLFAWTPPSGTPLALKLHPRICLIPESYKSANPDAFGITVTEITNKANSDTTYRGYIQEIVTAMDAVYDNSLTSILPKEATHIAINFAFLYAIDTPSISGLTNAHTKTEYGNEAIRIALFIADKMEDYTGTAPTGGDGAGSKGSWLDFQLHPTNEWYGPSNLSLAIVNDWVNAEMTAADKRAMMDGIINSYDKRYPQDMAFLADSKFFGSILHNGFGVSGFYGDTIDSSGTYYADTIDELMDIVISGYWLDGVFNLIGRIFDGTRIFQGADYDVKYSANNMAYSLPALSSMLNTNFYEDIDFLRDNVYRYTHIVNPRPQSGNYKFIGFNDSGGNRGKFDMDYGRAHMVFDPLMYALADSTSYSDRASLMKWVRDDAPTLDGDDYKYHTTYNKLFFQVLFSDRLVSVTSKSPTVLNTPTSIRMGNGFYSFRTGFTDIDDTVITFQAKNFHANDGGHGHRDFASFKIFKYGDLTTTRSIGKSFSGSGSKKPHNRNLGYNTIGVYLPGEDDPNEMAYRSGYQECDINPNSPVWQVNGTNHVGTVLREDINGGDYDYVDYDYSNAWSDLKVDYAEREFVYLKSQGGANDEYVVVFDRINSVDTSYTKYWLLQSPFTPKLLNNSFGEIIMTPEDYPNDPDTGGGRWVNKSSSPTQDNIIELTNTWAGNNSHGRLFNKTLLPEQFQINKTGGPGHYWEDAEGKLLLTRDLTEEEKNYNGTYTMQVQPTTGQTFDNFLNVMQFGDSNTLSSMNPTSRIDGDTMVGTLINDPTVPRVVMFSKDSQGASVNSVTYTANYSSFLNGKHLLVDMSSGTYDVYKNGSIILSDITASSQGVLSFSSTGGSTFQIVQTGSTPPPQDATPPAPPTGLSIAG